MCKGPQNKTWILGSAIVLSMFVTSGCFLYANKPNLVPEGYYEIVQRNVKGEMANYVSSEAARLDYPITVAVHPTDKTITINWTRNGERLTGEPAWMFWRGVPFWTKVTWWRFALLTQEEGPALCYTAWKQPSSEDVVKVPCDFDVKDHIAKPLIGMLDYRLDGDATTPPQATDRPEGVTRLYYLVLK